MLPYFKAILYIASFPMKDLVPSLDSKGHGYFDDKNYLILAFDSDDHSFVPMKEAKRECILAGTVIV